MGSPSLSIIIVNWNAGKQLHECVSSIGVTKQDAFTVSEVIIVDNGSTDSSLDGIDQLSTSVHIIKNIDNKGFGAACNQGAAVAIGDYLLFLNPDTRLFENSLNKPVGFMQDPCNSGVGICGIRLVDENDHASTSAARFPTLRVMVGQTLGFATLFPSVFPPHLLTSDELKESGAVDQVIGAFFLIRRSVFDRCEGFDERFFVYFEEVDLALRVKQLGYSSYFISEATAFHKGGGCSDQVKAARLFYSLRSRILYAQKHYSTIEFVSLVLLTGMELPMRLVQGVIRASWSDIQNTCSAYKQLVVFFIWRV